MFQIKKSVVVIIERGFKGIGKEFVLLNVWMDESSEAEH